MIAYNPKDWFTFIFRFHKSDTVRQLFPMIIAIGIYAALISYLEISIVKISKDSQLKNLSLIYSMLGFVISLLLVFRTNTAYERWWEGRKLWGQLINSSRNLSIKLNQIVRDNTVHKEALKTLIPYFAVALKSHLRNEHTPPELDENALTNNLQVIFCCGEQLSHREQMKHFNLIEGQLWHGLFHLDETQIINCAIAYEPVWAIGTGVTASPAQAAEMHSFIRKLLIEKYGESTANEISILYGGSCNEKNAAELFSQQDIDGGLIGGASLKADSFIKIIQSL